MGTRASKNPETAVIVRKWRKDRGWTQSQLAVVADVDARTIQRVEKDGSASLETLMAVAQAFEVDVKQLTPDSTSKERISNAPRVHLLPRLVLGSDLGHILVGADLFQVEHDDDQDPRSVRAMKDVLAALKQDVLRLFDANPVERLKVEDELSKEIKGLEGLGYYLFGIRRVVPHFVGEQRSLVSMATLYLSHVRSPKVVRDKALMVIPAVLREVVC
jgi:transcriptional regulator with XRE-family HTH domain